LGSLYALLTLYQLNSYVQREEEYQRRISEDSQQIKKLESDCATLKQQMKAAEEIKELLASDRSAELEAQSRMKSMQTTIDSQAQEIEGLKAQIKEAEEIHEEIEVKLAEESALTEERLQELQGQFADLEQQFDALQNENNALRVQCDEQAREFNFQLAQREEESLQGKKELEMVKANLSLSQSKVKNLQEENAKLSDELQAKAKAGQFDQSMLEEYTQAITGKFFQDLRQIFLQSNSFAVQKRRA
jgi:chromosome segregation ATPase